MEKYKLIERSIIKNYRKDIWRPFTKAITNFELIKENDVVGICLSGGKDSMLLAKCMEELHRHSDIKFDIKFLLMDPGYDKKSMKTIKDNISLLNLNVHIFKSDIFDSINTGNKSMCYECARKRRGHLYNEAMNLGCNKIALGHHLDDVIETIMLSILYGGEYKTMLPKLHSDHYKGMELIRPLYYVREENIIKWMNYNELCFINCACPFVKNKKLDSKRLEMKNLIKELHLKNEFVERNILASSENVNLNMILGYNKDSINHYFLDDYEERN